MFGSLALGLAPGRDCEGVNKENEEVLLFIDVFQIQIQGSECIELGYHNQRLLFNTVLLFWLLGSLAHFLYQPKIQVGQSPLESSPLALKPLSQAEVLGVDTDALRQVKPRKGPKPKS